MSEQQIDRKAAAEARLKRFVGLLLNGPDLKLPEPEPLPETADEVDAALARRVARLEVQAAFVQKVVWRTSAALIGAFISAGWVRDALLQLVATWLGGQ